MSNVIGASHDLDFSLSGGAEYEYAKKTAVNQRIDSAGVA
jgi:hypothetical protein